MTTPSGLRIAVVVHDLHAAGEGEEQYAIGLVAKRWRDEGHEVRFIDGRGDQWPADLAVLHIDNTVVPRRYRDIAARYPRVINGSIIDIRKTKVSSPGVWPEPGYAGPVLVKSDLNSSGIPERMLAGRSQRERIKSRLFGWRQPSEFDWNKRYVVYDSVAAIPRDVLRQRHTIVQKFVPELDEGHYFVRRCFMLGRKVIGYRMGHSEPIVDAHEPGLFSWIDIDPEVLEWRDRMGLDYGTIDYVMHDGEAIVLDVNKTPGRARPPGEEDQRDYERILDHIAPGLYDYVPASPASPAR